MESRVFFSHGFAKSLQSFTGEVCSDGIASPSDIVNAFSGAKSEIYLADAIDSLRVVRSLCTRAEG